jgi:hypothetical protein
VLLYVSGRGVIPVYVGCGFYFIFNFITLYLNYDVINLITVACIEFIF